MLVNSEDDSSNIYDINNFCLKKLSAPSFY